MPAIVARCMQRFILTLTCALNYRLCYFFVLLVFPGVPLRSFHEALVVNALMTFGCMCPWMKIVTYSQVRDLLDPYLIRNSYQKPLILLGLIYQERLVGIALF